MKTVALTLVGQRVLSPSETSNVGFTLRKLPKLINPTGKIAHNFTKYHNARCNPDTQLRDSNALQWARYYTAS